jgi:hypothetical protein
MDFEIKKEGSSTVLFSTKGSGRSGIRIDVNKGRRTLSIGGWYDTYVGIESGEISLDEINRLFEREPKSKGPNQTLGKVPCAKSTSHSAAKRKQKRAAV